MVTVEHEYDVCKIVRAIIFLEFGFKDVVGETCVELSFLFICGVEGKW